MSKRTRKILWSGTASIVGLVVLLLVAASMIVRTGWFEQKARQRIAEALNSATGGEAEIGAFSFDPLRLRATLGDFVLRGTEPEGEPPFLQVDRIVADLSLRPFSSSIAGVSSVAIERPRVNFIEFPDGTNNLPMPVRQGQSGKTPLETVVDLAIGDFRIREGEFRYRQQLVPFSVEGENLRVELDFDSLRQKYEGSVRIDPLFFQQGENRRIEAAVNVPVEFGRDSVAFSGATVATAESQLTFTASIDNIPSPNFRVSAQGSIGLAEVSAVSGMQLRTPAGGPTMLEVNVDAGTDDGRIEPSTLTLTLGRSMVEASGRFESTSFEDGTVQLTGNLAVGELVGLLESPPNASGTLELAAEARIQTLQNYAIDGRLSGHQLAFSNGGMRIEGGELTSTIAMDPNRIRVSPLRLDVAGGRLNAQATVEEFRRYQLEGAISGFQLQRTVAAAGGPETAWGSTIAGPVRIEGSFDGEPLRQAGVNLTLAPNGRGMPLRGEIAATYAGASDSLDLGESYLVFPSSRVDFSGSLDQTSLNQQLEVRLTSRNLRDFIPALALASSGPPPELPVRLDVNGSATVTATLTGKLSSPVIAGRIALDQFRVEDRPFDHLESAFRAASDGASIDAGTLRRGALSGTVSASVGLREWQTDSSSPVSADLDLTNADLRDVLALSGQSALPLRGGLEVHAKVDGTLGDPSGAAELHLRNGAAYGEPIDAADGEITLAGQRITLSSFRVVSNMSSATVNAVFEHPEGDFTNGTIRGHLEGTGIALQRIAAIRERRPNLQGVVRLDLDLEASVHPPGAETRVTVTAANGSLGAQNIRLRGQDLGNVAVDLDTSGDTTRFAIDSTFAGSRIRARGQTELAGDYPTNATLEIQGLPIEQALAVGGVSDLDAEGRLAVSGNISGTWKNPRGQLDLQLTQAKLKGQAIDSLRADGIVYEQTRLEIPSLVVKNGPSQVSIHGSFNHPANQFLQGDIDVSLASNDVQLAGIEYLQRERPGLSGTVRIDMDATGHWDQSRSTLPLTLSKLAAMVNANSIAIGEVNYGDARLSANGGGQAVNVTFDTGLADSAIRGRADVRMAADYPLTADVSVQGVRYSNWAALLGQDGARNGSFDVTAEGEIKVSGPALRPADLRGSAEFTTLEAQSTATGGFGKQARQIEIRNQGPVRLSVTADGIQVQQARWAGPSTSIQVAGGVRMDEQRSMDLKLTLDTELGVLESFNPDVSSEGRIKIDTAIQGTLAQPSLNGQIELNDAAYQEAGMLNGISEANGVILLAGQSARIDSLRAKSGSGDLTLSGSITRAGGIYRFDVQGQAQHVRVRTHSGASVISDATFRWTGTDARNLISGDVGVREVSFSSRTDIGSILTQAAPPIETPESRGGILDNMHLNITVRMGGNTTFRTSFAESLEATADLTVRGTARQPGVLGRIVLTQGELVFFGTKYSVNQGNVAFYDPNRVEPILNLNLSTTARGVSVVLMVTGPVENMNLAYQSDPPLQFSEIVALLAAGKAPTSDPVLLADQPPAQSLSQMGASAVLGTAVANPLANRLQRVFGVTQLKIDPTFTSGSQLPQARLTLQQQISPQLTFTYITNVTQSDPQIVRAEWTLDDNWSAIATRQENGMIGVDLFYKRRFQ